MKLHIKKGDEVVVLTGKDKGRKGKVLRVFAKKGHCSRREYKCRQAPHASHEDARGQRHH